MRNKDLVETCMNMLKSKKEIRTWAKEVRASLGKEGLGEKSKLIVEKIRELDHYKKAKKIMSFYPLDIEISLLDLFKDTDKDWYLPVVDHGEISICEYIPGKTKLNEGMYGVIEPEFTEDLKGKIDLDIIFVPGLAFDEKGYRIGFGKGYYDKFLIADPYALKIGCCPSDCMVDSIPAERWDYPVDVIVND